MKNCFYTLLLLACGCWWLSSCIGCIGNKANSDDVLKQVEVAVKTANLRTGPGTRYNIATPPNSSKGKWQVKRGTVLNVLAEEKGWYRIYVTDAAHTAYIKQSLCCKPGQSRARRKATSGKGGRRGEAGIGTDDASSDDYSSTGGSSSTASPAPSSPTNSSSSTATEDDFEEEVEEAKFIPKTR